MTRTLSTILFTLTLALHGAAARAQQTGGPDPEIRAHIDAFVAALRQGSADQLEAVVQAHGSPGMLARRTPAERRTMFERLATDFGAVTVTSVRVDDGRATLAGRGATGLAATFVLELERASPFRIDRIGIEAGNRGGEGGPPAAAIALRPDMDASAMGRALDEYLQPLVAADRFAGVVLIARDGAPVVTRAYGQADREAGRPAAPPVRFNLGSINKIFTKVAIGQLVAAGKLKFTDTVGALLADYPESPARKATVEQLLTHRGGVADFFGPAFDAAPKSQFRRNADYYRFVASQPVRFEPGAREEYCNGCYIVLGQIVERIAGVPYETYVRDHVFTPAGMPGAGWFASDALTADIARGYTRRTRPGEPDGPLQSNVDRHGIAGSAAGGGYATAADLLAFDTALRTGTLLDPERTAWMLQTDRAPAVTRARGGVGFAGGAPGINAALESDGTWTVAVLANLDPPAATNVAQGIRRALAF